MRVSRLFFKQIEKYSPRHLEKLPNQDFLLTLKPQAYPESKNRTMFIKPITTSNVNKCVAVDPFQFLLDSILYRNRRMNDNVRKALSEDPTTTTPKASQDLLSSALRGL